MALCTGNHADVRLGNQAEDSRISRLAAGVVEVSWLAAVCVVPLVFNSRGTGMGYDPFKFGAFQVLASLGLVAWIVGVVDRTAQRGVSRMDVWGWIRRAPFLAALGLWGVVLGISALVALDRHLSFWGAPETRQGFVSLAGLAVWAGMIACNLRTEKQLQRLVAVVAGTSLAMALLSFLQAAAVDPRVSQDTSTRPLSTAGNPIFLAGYLELALPLSIWQAWRWWREKRETPRRRRVHRAVWTTLMAIQLAGIAGSQSRGPVLGVLVMLLVFGWFWGVYTGDRRGMWILGGSSVALAGAFALLMAGWIPSRLVGGVPLLYRFSAQELNVDRGGEVRFQAWEAADQLMSAVDPLPLPQGGSDRLHRIRWWVGYGPESLTSVLPRYLSIRGRELRDRWDRCHNFGWDLLCFYGLGGALAFLAVVFAGTREGFRVLGWVCNGRETRILALMFAGGVGAASLGFAALKIRGFLGPGVLVGAVCGCLGYALCTALRGRKCPASRLSSAAVPPKLAIVLLAALAGYLIDLTTAFPSATTAVMLWLYLGLLGAVPHLRDEVAATQLAAGRSGGSGRGRAAELGDGPWPLTEVAILAAGLVAIVFSWPHPYTQEPMDPGQILRWMVVNQPEQFPGAYLLVLVPVAFLGLAGWLLAQPEASASHSLDGRFLLRVLGGGAGVALAYAGLHAGWIAAAGPLPEPSADPLRVAAQSSRFEGIWLLCLAGMVGAVGIGAWGLARPLPRTWVAWRPTWLTAGILAAGFALLTWLGAVRPLRANLASQWAAALENFGRSRLVPAACRRAAELAPQDLVYRGLLAFILKEQAVKTVSADAATKLFEEAEGLLLRRGLGVFDRTHFDLGSLYLAWAPRCDGGERVAKGRLAAEAFARAAQIEPFQEQIWTQAAIVDRLLGNNPAAAELKIQRALACAQPVPVAAAQHYAGLGDATPDSRLRAEYAWAANRFCDRVAMAGTRPEAGAARLEQANLLLVNGGDPAAAEPLLEDARRDLPPADIWKAEMVGADALRRKGDLEGARQRLRQAMRTSPPAVRPRLAKLLWEWGRER